jgi:hypothetical protein
MSRRDVIGIFVFGLLALGGWALAQPERPGAKGGAAEGGQFVISPVGNTAMLLETKSGKTWDLRQSINGNSVWLPAKRIDEEKDAANWRKEETLKMQLQQEGFK